MVSRPPCISARSSTNALPGAALPKDHRAIRTERTTLQKSLVQELPADIPVQAKKRLVKYEDTAEGALTLFFEDGTTTEVDLLIGADGLRSVSILLLLSHRISLPLLFLQAVRTQAFPAHELTFSGQVGFRTLVPVSLVKDILPDLPDATIFYHGDESTIFTTHVGNDRFELSLRARAPKYGAVSWGQDVKKSEVLPYFQVSRLCLERTSTRCVYGSDESESDRSALVCTRRSITLPCNDYSRPRLKTAGRLLPCTEVLASSRSSRAGTSLSSAIRLIVSRHRRARPTTPDPTLLSSSLQDLMVDPHLICSNEPG